MKRTKLISLLLSVAMLFSLAACSKLKGEKTETIKLDNCELLYKGACIMSDYEGNDALVITLDFTNNSKKSITYVWNILETVTQNGQQLDYAAVYTDLDTYTGVTDSQFEEVAAGATIEIKTAFLLNDTKNTVEATFEQAMGEKSGKITIDPSTLNRETTQAPAAGNTGNTGSGKTSSGITLPSGNTGHAGNATNTNSTLDWWNGDWYGWWIMTECTGYYEGMDGQWWDICGSIDIGQDGTGTVTLWDEDYSKMSPMAEVAVSLMDTGMSEYGTLISEEGYFTDMDLWYAEWYIDPAMIDMEDMILIDGYYQSGGDEYYYQIYLRPWGNYWSDMEEESLPAYYYDWYLPLIDAGEPMPNVIG